jgi:hypothetical protein
MEAFYPVTCPFANTIVLDLVKKKPFVGDLIEGLHKVHIKQYGIHHLDLTH